MKIRMESDRPVDLYEVLKDLQKNLPFSLFSLPQPVRSPKAMTVSVFLDSKSSETKEMEVFLNFGK